MVSAIAWPHLTAESVPYAYRESSKWAPGAHVSDHCKARLCRTLGVSQLTLYTRGLSSRHPAM